MEVFRSLGTILVIIICGLLSRKTNIFQKEHTKTISSFVYYFALPAFFLAELSMMDLSAVDYNAVWISAFPIILIIFFLYVLKLLKLVKRDAFILFGLTVSFGSYTFFGIAFFENLYDGRWLNLAVVTASTLGIVCIILTIMLFEYAVKKEQGIKFLFKILTNPLIIAIFLGVIFSLLNIRIVFFYNALSMLGKSGGGLAVFILGMFIYDNFSIRTLKNALPYSFFRTISLPLVTFIIISLFGDGSSDVNTFLLLQSGIPAAISLVVFAQRYEYKAAEVAGFVILTSIYSFAVISLLFFLSV